jgi:putative DNA primase/helicase
VLYSDADQLVFEGARPVVVNGIPDLGPRQDLADRIIHIVLRPIAPAERRSEREIERIAQQRLPLIFGALLDAVSRALRDIDTVPPPVTRMADFECWVRAAEPVLGCEEGAFLAAYQANRKGTVQMALEADPLVDPVRQLVEHHDWSSTPTQLHVRLSELASDAVRKSRSWPAVNKLRGRLRRIAPALRAEGIIFDHLDEKYAKDADGNRVIGIRRQRG